MKPSKSRAVLLVIAAATLLTSLVFSGMVVTVVHFLKFWGYPAYFATSMLVSGALLMVPSGREAGQPGFLGRQHRRLNSDFWQKVRRYGSSSLVILATLVIGPVGAGLSCRLIGISGRMAWVYCAVANLVATTIWVSVYLGLAKAVVSCVV
jgi:hypothetical protein